MRTVKQVSEMTGISVSDWKTAGCRTESFPSGGPVFLGQNQPNMCQKRHIVFYSGRR